MHKMLSQSDGRAIFFCGFPTKTDHILHSARRSTEIAARFWLRVSLARSDYRNEIIQWTEVVNVCLPIHSKHNAQVCINPHNLIKFTSSMIGGPCIGWRPPSVGGPSLVCTPNAPSKVPPLAGTVNICLLSKVLLIQYTFKVIFKEN